MRNLWRGIGLSLLILVGAATASRAQGVRFSGAPIVGDRAVSWRWDALEGLDPYFQGNTVLDLKRTIDAPFAEAVRLMRVNQDASKVYSVGQTDNRILIWDSATGSILNTLEAPSATILDLDLHRSEQMILAGLADGRIAFWDLTVGNSPEIYPAQTGACRFARFLVSSRDLAERRFVTAGAEEVSRVWDSPGIMRREIRTAGLPVSALATANNGAFLALGDPNGIIRIYQPLQSDQAIRRLEGHSARVADITFTVDISRMISADDSGRLISRDASGVWPIVFELTDAAGGAPVVGVRDPDGALIYSFDPNGTFRIYDGVDGRLYRQADLLQGETASGIAYGNFGREISIATDDGVVRTYQTGFCQPSLDQPSCFGGYMLWRSPTPREEDAVLLRIYGFGDSTWSFVGLDRGFTDPDSIIPRSSQSEDPLAGPHNGIPYYYSVTAFEKRYLNGAVFDVLLNSIDQGFYRTEESGPPAAVASHASAREETPLLSRVIVVPNPYEAGKVPWDGQAGPHVEFRNLPAQATIHLYTVAGDLVGVLEHGPGTFGESNDTRSWDLRNDRGEEITSGVYIYHITTQLNAEDTQGYFIVVR